MEVEITPEPEDRDAILAAVEAVLSRGGVPAAYRSGWREQGVRENVEDTDDNEPGAP